MPVLFCPRCRRANPDLAAYCYFDGFELRAPSDGAAFRMPREFVFPSGRRCNTYDDFAQGCQEEWAAARDLLQRGAFGQFFGNCGRADLVRAAQDANAQGSADAALATFLASLPGVRTQTPKLDINPRRFLLGSLLAGETRQLPLSITNAGQGTLQGTASITEGQDLASLGDGRPLHEVEVNAPRQQSLTLYLNTRGLPANQSHGAKLTVVSNGGAAEVPLRLDLVARPYTTAPFQGVKAQRELAEKMRAQPKAAVPLLESGEIRKWFEINGWTYPVSGPEVRGVAAVQQFFEAMGLSKPPPVQITPPEVRLRCKYPESARFQLTLSTAVKKWVYATVASDNAWLKVPQPQVSGPQQANFLIEVDSSRMATIGAHGEAKLKVVANGGQVVEVKVIADVSGMPLVHPGSGAGRASVVPARAVDARAVDARAVDARAVDARAVEALPSTATYRSIKLPVRSGLLASLLILPLMFLSVRVAMVPIADVFLRNFAIRSAAHRLGIDPTPDSPVGSSLAGWMRLPWPTIMGGGDAEIPGKLFNPASKEGIKADGLRDYFVSSFVRTLALLTFWLGGLGGAILLMRRGGILDVPWGFVSGCVAGLAGAATFASTFLVIDMVPQFIWSKATGDSGGWAWFGFVLLAVVSWLAMGAGAGMICAVLPPLRRLVCLPLQRIPASLFRTVGLRWFADFWWMPA